MIRDRMLDVGNALVALALIPWIGGIAILGAIVAPTVFRGATPEIAADVMTLIFRKHDRVVVLCVAALLVGEALRAIGLGAAASRGVEFVRYALCIVMATMSLYTAFVLSPRIETLHREGVIPGVGAAGARFERTHRQAELLARGVLLCGVVVAVLAAVEGGRPREGVS